MEAVHVVTERHRASAASTQGALRLPKQPFNAGDHVQLHRRWGIRLLALFKQNPASQFTSHTTAGRGRTQFTTNRSTIRMGWEAPPAQVARNTVGQLRPAISGRSEGLHSAEGPKRTCPSLRRKRLWRNKVLNVCIPKFSPGLLTGIS